MGYYSGLSGIGWSPSRQGSSEVGGAPFSRCVLIVSRGEPSDGRSLPPAPGRRLSPYIAVGAEIGAYRIEAFLDRGGMASIYEPPTFD